MATQALSKKRKSADSTATVSKKVKMVKSSEKAVPLKSALKKPRVEKTEEVVVEKPSRKEKTTTRTKIIEPAAVDENDEIALEDAENGDSALTADQTAALLAGFSSDEEDSDESDSGIPISSLPKAPTNSLTTTNTTPSDPETTPGVIYISRIPHGFYEPQMRAYFSQFGTITRLRLARNKRTGRSQHHAFIEFASAAVAEIVAKTMDKYLLFGHVLQVSTVPRERVSEGLFGRGSGRWKRPPPRNRMEGWRLRQGETREVWEGRVERENERRRRKEEVLREMGYEFEMPVVKSVSEVPVREKVEEGDAGVEVLAEEAAPPVDVVEVVETVRKEPGEDIITKETITKKRKASAKSSAKKKVKT